MKTINIGWDEKLPSNFTGIAIWPDDSKYWLVESKLHRLDGYDCQEI